jgi:hypothetical protein
MLNASHAHPEALLIYGRTRVFDENGKVEKLFGSPFNRALMYFGPLFYWQAAIIRRKVIELGCCFDETLEICEDRDFLNQIAEHSDFVFVPVVGFNYHPTWAPQARLPQQPRIYLASNGRKIFCD